MRLLPKIRPILFLSLTLIIACSSNAEESVATGLPNDVEIVDVPARADSVDEKLLPLGRLLVNRSSLEGLLLACTRLSEKTNCDRFRFVYFPNSSDLKTWHWLSQEFELRPENSNWSSKKRDRHLREWVRTHSQHKFSSDAKMVISYATLIFGFGAWGTTLKNYSNEDIQVQLFTGSLTIAALSMIFFSHQSLDWISLVNHTASRAIVGKRLERLNHQEENFLIRQAIVNHRIFDRLKANLELGKVVGKEFRSVL